MMVAMRTFGFRADRYLFKRAGAGAVVVGLLAVAATMLAAQGMESKTAAEDYHTNPKFLAAVKEARDMEREKHAGFAIDAYKKANKIAGGRCVECVAGVYKMQMMEGSYKDAIATAAEMEAMGTTPLVKSVADYDRGRALIAKDGEKAKPEQLEAQRAAFQAAVDAYPGNMAAVFNEGQVLARMGRIDEAKKDFELCLNNLKPGDAGVSAGKTFRGRS